MPDDADPLEEFVERVTEQARAEWDPSDPPATQKRLIDDLLDRDAPDGMIKRAFAGYYHDYASPYPMPKHLLVADAREARLPEIIERTKEGKYDP